MKNERGDLPNVYNEPAAAATPTPRADDRLLNKAELAAFCGVRTRTIENWMHLGLPYYKIQRTVRFKLADVMAYLETHHQRCHHATSLRRRSGVRAAG